MPQPMKGTVALEEYLTHKEWAIYQKKLRAEDERHEKRIHKITEGYRRRKVGKYR